MAKAVPVKTMDDIVASAGGDLIPFRQGEVIEVTITQILKAKVLVDVGGLALGFIPWASRTFKILRLLRSPSEVGLRFVLKGLLPAIGSIFVWIHLFVFDSLFISLGRVRHLR